MIYVFLAEGFEEVEALATVDVLRRAGLEVATVGVTGSLVSGSHKITVQTDLTLEQAEMNRDLDAVVLPGGMPGTTNLQNNAEVMAFVDYAYENGRLVCAICAAPSILGQKGMLRGRKACCFPGFEGLLEGAEVSDKPVCVDGNVITGRSCGVALEFGTAIAKAFIGEDMAQKLWESLCHE